MYVMDEILKALKTIIDNPDDLSSLPGVITQLEDYQKKVSEREASDLDRITALQSANRNLCHKYLCNGTPDGARGQYN